MAQFVTTPPSSLSDPTAVLQWRRSLIPANVGVSYASSPAGSLLLSSASGCYVTDSAGRRYLDCVNNVAHVGHSHPTVVQAAVQQLLAVNTNTRYLSVILCEYASALLSTFPPSLDRVYFVNSGSEANDLALRLVHAARPTRRDILCLDCAYHGSTLATIACSPYKFHYQANQPAEPHIHVCRMPNAYLGVGVEEAVSDVKQQLEAIQSAGREVLCFIHESAPSCAGQLLLPAGYLSAVYALVRAAGGMVIADEVQCGLGRNGLKWWEFERHGVVPDVVTAGKALGGSVYPIAAVVARTDVAAAFTNSGFEYFNTAAATNAAAAVGLAVLNTVRSEDSIAHAGRLGEHWLSGLRRLQSSHPLIGDVRGVGLFIGVEISQPGSATPAPDEAAWLVNRMRLMQDEHQSEGTVDKQAEGEAEQQDQSTALSGVLLSTDGPHHNVIKIKPPMTITQSDVDYMLRLFERALSECEQWRSSHSLRND